MRYRQRIQSIPAANPLPGITVYVRRISDGGTIKTLVSDADGWVDYQANGHEEPSQFVVEGQPGGVKYWRSDEVHGAGAISLAEIPHALRALGDGVTRGYAGELAVSLVSGGPSVSVASGAANVVGHPEIFYSATQLANTRPSSGTRVDRIVIRLNPEGSAPTPASVPSSRSPGRSPGRRQRHERSGAGAHQPSRDPGADTMPGDEKGPLMIARRPDLAVMPDPQPAPQRGVTPHYDPDVVERCYELWSTSAAMNASATRRRYEQEVPDGTPIPTDRTIRNWATDLGWLARRDEDFARNHGERLYEMQLRDLLNFVASGEEIARLLAGFYDDNPAAGLLRLKVREVLGREYERKITPVLPSRPATEQRAWDSMSLDEQEAFMRGTYQARKG